jgi:allantoate deiminase
MLTDKERIKRDIEELSRFNATPGEGLSRFSFSKEDRTAREYIKEKMRESKLEIYEDAAGTIIGRRAGIEDNLPVIMVGSHFDSVKNGGNFDGPAGVITGLEIARVLNDRKLKTKYPLEFIAMIEEEGARFGSGLFGSRSMVGKVTRDDLNNYRDENGITIAEAMQEFDFNPDNIKQAKRDPKTIKAFFELHIEQGPVLESENKDIGIVDAIVGIDQYNVEITGISGHAGTTPMNMRKDALVLSSDIIKQINYMAKKAGEGTVATVGNLKVYPGGANIIPKKVWFSIDVRSRNKTNIKNIAEEIEKSLVQECRKQNMTYNMEKKLSVNPVMLSREISEILEKSCKKLGFSYKRMVSGAGHDAMVLAEITNVGLVFVPSKDGKSHCPEEWTDYEQLQKGIELVLEAVLDIAEDEV